MPRSPLVIRGQQGTGRGNAATHSQSLESLFMHIPGLKVVCPSTPADAAGLLRTAIRDDNPVCFFEHKVLYATRVRCPTTGVLHSPSARQTSSGRAQT